MENIIHPHHRGSDAIIVADIPDIAFDFRVVVLKPNFLLLFFIAAEDPDFFDLRSQESAQNCIAKRAGTPGYQECAVCEHESCLPERGYDDANNEVTQPIDMINNSRDAKTQKSINEKGLDFQCCDLNIITMCA
jgi:hypothetical protein